jgi:ubiquitin C-terminal hydrolase
MSAPVGLKNHGNTCFINAIEQCFRSVECYMGRQWPRPFATKEYPDLDQQDAHEYHLFVLMRLEETVPDFKTVFQGMFETRVEFPCGHANVHQEPFCELSIPLFSTFEKMLESLESADRVTSSCDACGYQGTATKKTTVDRLPPFTVFHVKRFGYDFNKRGDPINVPLRWEFVRNGGVYRLLGFVVHHGKGLDVGHYVAYVRYDRTWYLCNDDRVVEAANAKEEALPNAYMLFYGLTSLRAPMQIQPRAVRRR